MAEMLSKPLAGARNRPFMTFCGGRQGGGGGGGGGVNLQARQHKSNTCKESNDECNGKDVLCSSML